MDIHNITSNKSSIMNRKIIIHDVSFILLAETFPEVFPKQKGYIVISESFALN